MQVLRQQRDAIGRIAEDQVDHHRHRAVELVLGGPGPDLAPRGPGSRWEEEVRDRDAIGLGERHEVVGRELSDAGSVHGALRSRDLCDGPTDAKVWFQCLGRLRLGPASLLSGAPEVVANQLVRREAPEQRRLALFLGPAFGHRRGHLRSSY